MVVTPAEAQRAQPVRIADREERVIGEDGE
jgi:hypothetical protein